MCCTKIKSPIYLFLAVLVMNLTLFLVSGCSQQEKAHHEINKGPAPAMRIISLAPSITEILFALGLGDNVVGVTTYCDYPPEARDKEKIGSFSRPNIERIISLKPDLILTTSLEQSPIEDKLKQLKFKIEIVYPETMEDLFSSIRRIGGCTGVIEQAENLVQQMKARLKTIEDKVSLIPDKDRKEVFIEIWYDPITTAGPESFVNELITLAGGVNIAYDAPREYSRFSPELVIKRNPDVIILGYMDRQGRWAEALKSRAGWGNIKAVREGKVFDDLEPDLFLRPGPRAVIGVEEIYKRLYE